MTDNRTRHYLKSRYREKVIEHTERAFKSRLRFTKVIPLILILGGCSTSMNKFSDPNEPLTASDGIVIGSALVRTVKSDNQSPIRVAPMFLVPAHNITFLLNIEELKGLGYLMEEPNIASRQFSLNITPDEEKVFVTKIPAGPYHMRTLQPRGYEEATALLGIRFTVAQGTVTYIGRVVFEVPEKLPLNKALPKGFNWLKPAIQIEDAQEATVESIRSTYGPIVQPVVKDLMRPR